MTSIPNTIRRRGVYHLRRPVPADLRKAFRRKELSVSLRTSDPATARNLSRFAYLQSDALFDTVRSDPMLGPDDIRALVRDFYESILDRDNAARLASDAPMPEAARQARIDHYEELAENSRRDLAANAFGSTRSIAMALLAKRYGLDASFDQVDNRLVMQSLLRAGIDVCEALAARYRGDFSYQPKDKVLAEALAMAALPAGPVAAPAGPVVADPAVPSRLFSEVAEEFRAKQVRQKLWTQHNSQQVRKTYDILIEVLGDRQLSDYARSDAGTLKSHLEDLPANYAKSTDYTDLTTIQIVDQTRNLTPDEPQIERLSSRTVQRHFSALSALWRYGLERGWAARNPFIDFKFPAPKRARDQRSMWSDSELAALFDTPVWRGCQSKDRRAKPGNLVLKDSKFWIPLIGLHSGMRLDEICGLAVDDVRLEGGILVFDTTDRTLKTRKSSRIVPVHKQLLAFGFGAYLDEQRSRKSALLFPELKPGGPDGKMSANFTIGAVFALPFRRGRLLRQEARFPLVPPQCADCWRRPMSPSP
ncbi:MAG: DUF6538 domain-containing protein [Novosphingobium sp.]